LVDFLKTLTDDEAFKHLTDDDSAAEFGTTIDSGSYLLNALLSGSLFGGFPDNKVLALAGESTVGKTYFGLSLVASFLQVNPKGLVLYFDTEAAVTRRMFEGRGINPARIAISNIDTVEKFRTQALTALTKYEAHEEDTRPPMMFVLDSLGGLASEKELKDSLEGNFVGDMTRAKAIRATFRMLRLKLAKLKVPMIVTNHTYQQIGAYVPTTIMAGGQGLKYAADIVIELSKKLDKNAEGEIQGFIIKAKLAKGRFTRERTVVETLLSYEKGLNRYHGLLEHAVDLGVVKSTGKKFTFPDGKDVFRKKIDEDPQAFWTDAVLKTLDEKIAPLFLYQTSAVNTEGE
jgi:RecA/RadA recombinase